MIRHKILSFTHEKIFRHDKSREPNKFTNFIAAILMPIYYIIDHNTSLRYDWNRDIYVINKMEFTGALLRNIHSQEPKISPHGENYAKLANEPKDHEYDKLSYMHQPLPVSQEYLYPDWSADKPYHDNWFYAMFGTPEQREKKRAEKAKNLQTAPGGTRIGTKKPKYKPSLWRGKKVTDLFNNQRKKEIQMKINLEIARICFEANKQYCIKNELPFAAQTFDEQTDEYKEGIVAGVAKVITDPKITAAESHANWLKSKKADGWKLGKVVDYNKKLHPNMVPFDKLDKVEQDKDKLFIKTVKEEMKK